MSAKLVGCYILTGMLLLFSIALNMIEFNPWEKWEPDRTNRGLMVFFGLWSLAVFLIVKEGW